MRRKERAGTAAEALPAAVGALGKARIDDSNTNERRQQQLAGDHRGHWFDLSIGERLAQVREQARHLAARGVRRISTGKGVGERVLRIRAKDNTSYSAQHARVPQPAVRRCSWRRDPVSTKSIAPCF